MLRLVTPTRAIPPPPLEDRIIPLMSPVRERGAIPPRQNLKWKPCIALALVDLLRSHRLHQQTCSGSEHIN